MPFWIVSLFGNNWRLWLWVIKLYHRFFLVCANDLITICFYWLWFKSACQIHWRPRNTGPWSCGVLNILLLLRNYFWCCCSRGNCWFGLGNRMSWINERWLNWGFSPLLNFIIRLRVVLNAVLIWQNFSFRSIIGSFLSRGENCNRMIFV